jgi:hypothetical protein
MAALSIDSMNHHASQVAKTSTIIGRSGRGSTSRFSGPRGWYWNAAALIIAWIVVPLAAGADPIPLARQLLVDARDDRLDQHDLLSACLVAGGVTGADELRVRRARVAAALDAANLRLSAAADVQDRAAALHGELHRTILTGRYDKHASDVVHTVASGDYNCLTATTLYAELCRRAGVPLEIWAQPGHVSCLVGTPPLRVEAAVRQFPCASHVAAGSLARRITPIQLAGRFAYNRGIELLERREFEPGIAAIRLACQLDPHDADARANLLAGLNNWALALAEQDQPAAAAALIARGLAIDPHFAPLVANQRYVAERAQVSSPQ